MRCSKIFKICRMRHLLRNLEGRLATLPVPMATGEIGNVDAAIVEGRVALEGGMRDLIAAAAGLLIRDPARDKHHGWWQRVLARARFMAAHTLEHDARHAQFHYDLSDDFYALWLDPRRGYPCAYYRSPDLILAQAQEAKLDHICRKLQLQPGDRFLDMGAGWGGLVLWATEHYRVDATGITLSRNQHVHVLRLIEESAGCRGACACSWRTAASCRWSKPSTRSLRWACSSMWAARRCCVTLRQCPDCCVRAGWC